MGNRWRQLHRWRLRVLAPSLLFFGCVAGCVAGCEDVDSIDSTQATPPAQLRLGTLLGASDNSGFEQADRPIEFQFPRDHAAHPSFRSEWWYLTLLLEDNASNVYGVQLTIFRQALKPAQRSVSNAWLTEQIYLGHFAISDVTRGQHRAYERVARGHPRLAGVRAEPFRLWLEDWQIEAQPQMPGSIWHLSAQAGEGAGRDAVDLDLNMDTQIVPQGFDGLSRKGEQQASYYYSVPKIPVVGTLTVGGEEHSVHGTGWLDREWSTNVLDNAQRGWDWFALQMDDGRSLMVFQLRRDDYHRDPFDAGMLVSPTGEVRILGAQDFALTPIAHWLDSDGTAWPIEWQLRLADEEVRIVAAIDDQRMALSIIYWEGLVDVFGESANRIGGGYMELTGYGDDRGTGR